MSSLEPASTAPEVLLGHASSAHVRITVLRRSFPDASDFWDGNWLNVEVEVAAGAFRGRFPANLRTTEFEDFAEELQTLHADLRGTASFSPLEEQCQIEIEGDGRGHFSAKCRATDAPGVGNRLSFELSFDQTELPQVVVGLRSIIAEFPTRGSRCE